jgi:hypothetical protein
MEVNFLLVTGEAQTDSIGHSPLVAISMSEKPLPSMKTVHETSEALGLSGKLDTSVRKRREEVKQETILLHQLELRVDVQHMCHRLVLLV